jgi:hypothetical protein
LLHELAHVKQKHSLDILMVELLQIVFWFIPILSIYRKAIKLNHEFLADTAVLKKHKNIVYYQQLLLATASFNSQHYLASSINYSVTKKRLEMMTKHTKKAKTWIKSLVLIPLFSFLLYSFSETVKVTDPLLNPSRFDSEIENLSAETKKEKILSIKFSNETVFVDGKQTTVSNFANSIDQLTTDWTDSEIKDASLHIRLNNAPDSLIDQISAEYGKTRFAKINGHKMLPPPPPAPPAPPKVLKGQTSNIPPPQAPRVMKGEISNIPPPPPAPPIPSEHMKELAAKGAVFFLEDKSITAKQAIQIAKDNEDINILIRDHDSKKPIVKLSTKPIRIKR